MTARPDADTRYATHLPKKLGMKPGAEDFPLMVLPQVSNVCNSGCVHCWFNTNPRLRDRDGQKFMGPALLKKIIDEMAAQSNRPLLRITGTGEPFLMPQLTDLLVYAAGERGLRAAVITNGSLVTPERGTRLVDAGLEALEISVDAADEKTYEGIRRGLKFRRIMENIEHLVAHRDKTGSPTRILVSVVENTAVIDPPAVEAFWKTRVDKVIMRKYLTYGQLSEDGCSEETYLPPEARIPCPYPFERMPVMSTGDVTFCNFDVEDGYFMGNVGERSIAEIWRNEKFEAWRKLVLEGRFEEMPLCAKCTDWKYKSWTYNFFKAVDDAKGGAGGPVRG